MALTLNVVDEKAEKIVMKSKLRTTEMKLSLSSVVIALLDKWNKGEIDVEVKRSRK
jgi:hypothetical protein